MKIALTHQQMLQLWRSRAGLDSNFTTIAIDTVDGIDTDTLLAQRMRAWYIALLDNAPLHLLATEDYAASLHLDDSEPIGRVDIPSQCRRIVSARLASWTTDATVVEAHQYPDLLRRQRNPYAAATPDAPVAVMLHGSLLLAPCENDDTLTSLMAVVDPGDETYSLDEAALALIPDRLDSTPTSFSNIII